MAEYTYAEHSFGPVIDEACKILILGSFPSVKSREEGFFYGHPQNRFWRILAAVFEEETPKTIEEKKAFLLSHHIALYDVIESCEIIGSADSSIRHVRPADIAALIAKAPIERVYVNGALAKKLYDRYLLPIVEIEAVKLPSSSAANARYSLDMLTCCWKQIR